jgi:hypothetical protein
MSSFAVSAFIAIRMSTSFRRATYPYLLARMVYQVGRPAMLEGKRFLPLTGTPIAKILRRRTLLADCEPDPFTVATWILKSFTTGWEGAGADSACADGAPALVVAMGSLQIKKYERKSALSLSLL